MELVSHRTATYKDIAPDKVLTAAIGELDSVLLLGVRKDGNLYFASSKASAEEILELTEIFKKRLKDSLQ